MFNCDRMALTQLHVSENKSATRTTIALSEKALMFHEALELSSSLASNNAVDGLVMSNRLGGEFRTGTLVWYAAPDEKFGRSIKFQGKIFPVPRQFQGIENCALVMENSGFIPGHIGLKPDAISLVEEFPSTSGFYLVDPHGIPHGRPVPSTDASARHLSRIDGSYGGSVVRSSFKYFVDLTVSAYRSLPVALVKEVSDNGNFPESQVTITISATPTQIERAAQAWKSLQRMERDAEINGGIVNDLDSVLRQIPGQ
jgi:hypothetical protein